MEASRIARRFPLVPRPRPQCLPLPDRVQEVRLLARKGGEPHGLSSAAAALNRAALIASDCGVPLLARELCWQHADAYLRARPLDAQTARFALEPLVNLARLLIRAGQGEEAYQLLASLNHAIQDRTDITVDGRLVPARSLLAPHEDNRALKQWMWSVLLGDGTRALVAAEQWPKARAHVRQANGVGLRLLDGRQIEIVAACLEGDPSTARQTVLDSTPLENWEEAVAACLIALCGHAAGESPAGMTEQVTNAYISLHPNPELAVFQTRVGLTALTLVNEQGRERIARHLVLNAVQGADGYVAKDLVEDPTCTVVMTERQHDSLIASIAAAGLATGRIPLHLERLLLEAADAATTAIATYVAVRQPS